MRAVPKGGHASQSEAGSFRRVPTAGGQGGPASPSSPLACHAEAGERSFQRTHRLVNKRAFQRVFDQPLKLSGKYFILFARPNDVGHPRLGLAIAKKAVKTSVERNRVRRICRESFRLQRAQLPAVDIIVMVQRGGICDASNAALFASLSELWSRLIARCVRSC